MRASDFVLTEHELASLNAHLAARSGAYVEGREDAPAGLRVCFDFVPGLGREVTAYLDGDVSGHTLTALEES